MSQPWTTKSLFDALIAHEIPAHEPFHFTLVRGSEPVIEVVCNDHGGLTLHVSASGSRIFISAVLCTAESVNDRAGFNDACLRLNPITPLSNIGLQTTQTGDLYTVFGELSAHSPLTNILEEIDVLAHNALQVTDVLHPYIH